MAGRIVERKGLKFEVWEKSLCLREPRTSPMFCSFNSLKEDEQAIKAIDDFIAIMNIGIDIHTQRRI
jgi:hypothetical protein